MELELIGLAAGTLLTILVFSYLLGDNPFYRLALHVFLGALVGYTFGVMIREVWFKLIVTPLLADPTGNMIVAVPVLIGLSLFLFKSIPRLAYVGNFPLAFLIGVGIAVTLVGAFIGTLAPQFGATVGVMNSSPWEGAFIAVGTVCTLLAFDFTFTQQKRGLGGAFGTAIGLAGKIGRLFLTVALGVAFAGAMTAALSVFIGRIQFLIEAVIKLLAASGFG
jgi:hypothetical protein